MTTRKQQKEKLKRLQDYMWIKEQENKDPEIKAEKDRRHKKIRDEKRKKRERIQKNKAKRKKRNKNKKSRGDILEVSMFGKTVTIPTSPSKEKMHRKSRGGKDD